MKLQIYIIVPCVVLAIHVEAMYSGILMVFMQKLQDTLNAQNVISSCLELDALLKDNSLRWHLRYVEELHGSINQDMD